MQPNWIDGDEQWPEVPGTYLTYWSDGALETYKLDEKEIERGRVDLCGESLLFWAELPEPPRLALCEDKNLISECGCRFEGDQGNTVLLCEACGELPCHTGEPAIKIEESIKTRGYRLRFIDKHGTNCITYFEAEDRDDAIKIAKADYEAIKILECYHSDK